MLSAHLIEMIFFINNNGFGIVELINGATIAIKSAIAEHAIRLKSSITMLAKGSKYVRM